MKLYGGIDLHSNNNVIVGLMRLCHEISKGLDLFPGRSQRSMSARGVNEERLKYLAMAGNRGISQAASIQGPGVSYKTEKPQCPNPEG
jgi:hypothetical protein